MLKTITLLCFSLMCTLPLVAQDDLMSILEESNDDSETRIVSATFKSTRLVNGHTTEMRPSGVLEFIISHRFGRLNEGVGQLFGLDDSQVRIALEYGIWDKLNVGFGRSSVGKILDGFLKYQVLRQTKSGKMVPISLTAFTSVAVATGPGAFLESSIDNKFSQRLSYSYQLLAARKMNSNLSLQVMPTMIHRNYVFTTEDPNDVFALGFGGRYKLTNRLTLNAEYYHQLAEHSDEYYNSFSIGFDIETGGHVFQLHLTNSRSMIEKGFVAETSGRWADGAIHYGFNISRVFNLKAKK